MYLRNPTISVAVYRNFVIFGDECFQIQNWTFGRTFSSGKYALKERPR